MCITVDIKSSIENQFPILIYCIWQIIAFNCLPDKMLLLASSKRVLTYPARAFRKKETARVR